MRLHLSFFVCLLTLTGSVVSGGITWEKDSISATGLLGEKEIAAQYRFRNTGDSAISIQTLSTDCDCTKVSAKDTNVPPGKTGEINVRYIVGHYSGRITKNISVRMMDSTGVFSKTLKLDVTIPCSISVTPALLMWEVGGVVERTADIYIHPDLAGRSPEFSNTSDAFDYSLSKDTENRLHYWLKITPKVANKPFHHEIRLTLDGHPEQTLAVVTLAIR